MPTLLKPAALSDLATHRRNQRGLATFFDTSVVEAKAALFGSRSKRAPDARDRKLTSQDSASRQACVCACLPWPGAGPNIQAPGLDINGEKAKCDSIGRLAAFWRDESVAEMNEAIAEGSKFT